MKLTKAIFILFFFSLTFYGQNSKNKVIKGQYSVISTNGLNLRDAPNLNSNILKKLRFASKIEIIEDKSFGIDTIGQDTSYYKNKKNKNPIIGNWIKVKYNNLEGFLFDAYLGTVASMEKRSFDDSELNLNKDFVLLFPGIGCDDNFWPTENMNWLGLYQEGDNFKLKKIELSYYNGWNDNPDPMATEIEDFRISTNDNKNLLFILGSKENIKQGIIKGKLAECSRGDNFKEFNKLQVSGTLRNPILKLKSKNKQQILNSNHIDYYHPSCVIWEGDLDHDGNLDYIISYGDKSGRTYLYLSSQSENGKIVKPVSVFFSGYCC